MAKYKLLERFGIELEYMIVDKDTYDIKTIADEVLKQVAGEYVQEVDRPRINWSNELALHVIEVKNKDPEPDIQDLLKDFQVEVKAIQDQLQAHNATLLPGAVHPWMDPETAKLWPHSNKVIYNSYDRIFGCKGHGWSNLQSMHINISFNSDEEFHKLHSAIRIVLPLIPAICSSSPVIDGKKAEKLSSRLSHYLNNQRRIPSIIGQVIPEAVTSKADYQEKILKPMYKDIAPLDTENVLQHEWLNSRAAIAKFKYGCIEIRLADVQEAPIKDLATASFFTSLIKEIATNSFVDLQKADQIHETDLKAILLKTASDADSALIEDKAFLGLFRKDKSLSAGQLLQDIYERLSFSKQDEKFNMAIQHSLTKGPLSKRLLKALNDDFSHNNLKTTYRKLTDNLLEGTFFEA